MDSPLWTGYALATSDATLANDATPNDDSVLVFTPTAGANVLWASQLRFNAGATPDFRVSVNVGNATQALMFFLGTSTVEDLSDSQINTRCFISRTASSAATVAEINGNSTAGFWGIVYFRGVLVAHASPTQFAIRWSQGNSGATSVTRFAGSWLAWKDIT